MAVLMMSITMISSLNLMHLFYMSRYTRKSLSKSLLGPSLESYYTVIVHVQNMANKAISFKVIENFGYYSIYSILMQYRDKTIQTRIQYF